MSYFLVYYQTVILVRSSATIESNMVKVNIPGGKKDSPLATLPNPG